VAIPARGAEETSVRMGIIVVGEPGRTQMRTAVY
jgi:hypothetical protein